MNPGMWKGSLTGILPNLCLKITITICLVSVENLVLDQLIIPFIDIFLYSHYLSACYCIDIVRRNSVLVACGS